MNLTPPDSVDRFGTPGFRVLTVRLRLPNPRQTIIRLTCLLLIGGFDLLREEMIVLAQANTGKSKPAPKGEKNAKKGDKTETETNTNDELPELSFDTSTLDIDEYVADPDDTPEGKARLEEVVNRARQVYVEYAAVEKERRPLAGPRDVMVGEIIQFNNAIAAAGASIANAQAGIVARQNTLAIMNNPQLKAEIAVLQANIAGWNNDINAARAGINFREPKVVALNIAIKPLDEKLRKLWEELNSCRKQWLDLRVPLDKYSRADFEKLKVVIDDWLRVDGLWPQAFCFGALCAFELGDYEKAMELVERAEKLRVEVVRTNRKWPQIQALQGLIAYRSAGQGMRTKSATLLQKATSGLEKDKDKDWETQFVIGRAFAEKDGQSSKAKAFLERALKVKPNCLCAKYWLARLQTSSSEKSVQDLDGGIELLESVWSRTGKRTWRISFALVQAYDAGNRSANADRQWEDTLKMAPASEHRKLMKLREESKKARKVTTSKS